jgi:hypothetical protein
MVCDLRDWAGYLRFRPAFEGVMDSRLYTIDWLDRQVLSGAYCLFATPRAAILAEIKTYPTGAREVHGVVAAGDLQEIEERLIPEAEAWGRSLGCIAAQIDSRDGWARVMKKHGYRPHQTVIRKELG